MDTLKDFFSFSTPLLIAACAWFLKNIMQDAKSNSENLIQLTTDFNSFKNWIEKEEWSIRIREMETDISVIKNSIDKA